MILRDPLTLIIVVLALLLGAVIFAVSDPGSKDGFYTPDSQPVETTP
jgi:hypothetical protein